MRRTAMLGGVVALVFAAGACDRGEETPGTTSLPAPASTVATTVAAPDPTSTAATVAAPADDNAAATEEESTTVGGMPSYEVAQRVEATDGEELVVVVEPGTYTNVELQNLVFDIVDRFAPLRAVVVDDADAVPLVLADERTPDQDTFLEQHTFLELVDGVEVTFLGPYSDLAGIVVGS